MAHIVGAERLWLARLRNEPPPLPVWPELDLDDTAPPAGRVAAGAGRGACDVSTRKSSSDGVGYRNSKGEFWTSTVADILTHVSHHGAYHRGQIAVGRP